MMFERFIWRFKICQALFFSFLSFSYREFHQGTFLWISFLLCGIASLAACSRIRVKFAASLFVIVAGLTLLRRSVSFSNLSQLAAFMIILVWF